jgi:hypothetical protein
MKFLKVFDKIVRIRSLIFVITTPALRGNLMTTPPAPLQYTALLPGESINYNSIADPDPGSSALLTPGSGMEKLGSGINIPGDPQHCITKLVFYG